MRSIYIRHADKDFKNGESELFKHDPGITETGVEKAKSIALKLIEEYGEPDRIVSSPFRRARETALIMNSLLKNPLEEIQIDTRLSEYLGNHNNVELDVTTATKIHDPPHPESFEGMKSRVKKHVDKIRKHSHENPKEIVWFITHGIIIKQIAGIFGIKSSKQLPFLTCFSFVEKADITRAEFLLFPETCCNMERNIQIFNKKRYPRIDKVFFPRNEYKGRDDITGRNLL